MRAAAEADARRAARASDRAVRRLYGEGVGPELRLIRQYARAGSLRHALAVYTSAVHPPPDDASGGGDARENPPLLRRPHVVAARENRQLLNAALLARAGDARAALRLYGEASSSGPPPPTRSPSTLCSSRAGKAASSP